MRKLALLTVTAIAALAFAAPSASASPVEIEAHSNGLMCDLQPNTRCRVHVTSEPLTFTRHSIIGELQFRCEFEANLHVYKTGLVAFENETVRDHAAGTGNCENIVECHAPVTTEWFGLIKHFGAQEKIDMFTCFDPPLVASCEGWLETNLTHTQEGAEEAYMAQYANVTILDESLNPTECEVSGELNFERVNGYVPIEIHHL